MLKRNFALLLLMALVAIPARAEHLQDVNAARYNDFGFPVALCVFTQWDKIKSVDAKTKIEADDFSHEIAFPVEHIQQEYVRAADGSLMRATSGDFEGMYQIPNSPYRVRVEGKIQQGIIDGSASGMTLHSFLEKRDAQDPKGAYAQVGEAQGFRAGKASDNGVIWENISAYAFNSSELASYQTDGRADPDKIVVGLRDGKLSTDMVYKAGPVCGLLDAVTAKQVSSNRDKLHDIFDRIPDLRPTLSAAQPTVVAQDQSQPSEPVAQIQAQPEQQTQPEQAQQPQEIAANPEQQDSQQQPAAPAAVDPNNPAYQEVLANQQAAAYNNQVGAPSTATEVNEQLSQLDQQQAQIEARRAALVEQHDQLARNEEATAQQQAAPDAQVVNTF